MEGPFLSNLNAFARESEGVSDKQLMLSERLEDAASILGDMKMVLSGWNESAKAPNCNYSFYHLMIDPTSVHKSSAVVNEAYNGGGKTAPLNIKDVDKIDMEKVKAIVALGAMGYRQGSSSSFYSASLILKVDGVDNSGKPIVSPVNGKVTSDGMIIPPIANSTKLILLTGIPELMDEESNANVFVLGCDCLVLGVCAKRGDVMCAPLRDRIYKCFSFQEKFNAVISSPGKMIPHYAVGSVDKYPVYCVYDLDTEKLGDVVSDNSFYAFLLEGYDTYKTVEGKSVVDKSFRKGSFWFVDMTEYKVKEVPFDQFFQ